MTSLDEIMNEVEEQEKNASDFYKIKEGANKMRILSDFVKVESVFNNGVAKGFNYPERELEDGDTISMKGWAWAVIRATEEIKIVQLSKTILKQITALKNGEEYQFDTFPMPYDITINAVGAGTKEVDYTTTPARQNTEVSQSEIAELNKKKTLQTIVQAIADKQSGKKAPIKKADYPTEVAPADKF